MKLSAVIMAGGRGSRLYPLTESTPKPLLPVNNIPNIIKILAEISRYGIKKAAISVGYLASELEKRVGSSVYDVDIVYAYEETPLGTAGGVKNASKYLDGDLLVISGDAVFEGDLSKMIESHYKNRSDVTIACKRIEDTSSFGVLVTDSSGRVTRFCEKPKKGECDSDLANIGIYVISRGIIDSLPENEKIDFSLDVFPRLLKDFVISAWETGDYWCDMGTLSSYLDCNMRYSHGSNIIGKNCSISPSAQVKGSVIFDGVTIEAGACVSGALICSGAHIGRDAGVPSGSVVGENCHVADRDVLSPGSVTLSGGRAPNISANG
ncbi:MAG: NTP transferase domain-containing protein [Clostridia bacterium]|nr:NTP transferase domain-containing protein [Clostridia bacterium]